MAKLCSDTFASRTVTGGWGTASDGNTWAQAYGGGTLSVGSGKGKVTGNTGINTMLLGSNTATDIDIKVRFSVTATTNVASITFRSDSGAQNAYRARYTGTNFSFTKIVAGSTSSFGAGATVSVAINTLYWIHVQTAGSTLRANLWADGSSEPAGWQLNVGTDSTFTGPGLVGVHAQCHATTDNVQFDSFTANTTTDTLDVQMRARFAPPTITKDAKLRMRLAGIAAKDVKLRAGIFAPTSTRDVNLRMGLLGFSSRDIAMRANIEETVIALPAYTASQLSIQIGDYPAFTPKENTFSYSETSDGRSTCSFALTDLTGQLHFQWRMPVVVTHSVRGEIFRGYLNTPNEQNLPPNAANTLQFVCIDEHWLADKNNYEGNEFVNQFAGDIATFLAKTLAPEGVTSGYAIDYDTSQDDFAEGTLVGVVAAKNIGTTAIGDGDLELAPSGQTLSIVEQTFDAFNGFILIGTQANDRGNGLASLGLFATQAIQFKAQATVPSGGNLFTYYKVWSGSALVFSGDALVYDMWISGDSPEIKAGVDLVFSDGSRLAANGGLFDGQGQSPHPGTDLKGLADNQWYHRRIDLSPYDSKNIVAVLVAFEGDTPGNYAAWFRHILQKDSGNNTVATFFEYQLLLDPPVQISNNGYLPALVQAMTSYEQTGSRESVLYPLDSIGFARTSLISWDVTLPTDPFTGQEISGVTVDVYSSFDEGNTWQLCENLKPIPNLLPGASLAGRTLELRQVLTNTTSDPTQGGIALNQVTASIAPSFVGNKIDLYNSAGFNADFAQGTLINLRANNDSLQFNQYVNSFDSSSGMTLFGSSGPAMNIVRGQLKLQSGNGTDVRARLDAAGIWQDFSCEVDVFVPLGTATNVGLVYRTTGWQNNNDSYAYNAYINGSQIVLGKGTNSGSGAGSFTQIASAALSLTQADWHRLRVNVTGSFHALYLDDVQYVTATDSSYTGAGNIGLRLYNNAGTTTLHTALTGGVAVSSIVVNGLSATIPNATLITVDTNGAHPETVYAYGDASAATGNVTVSITTNSAGNGAAQANWTPGFSHSSSVTVTFPHNESALFDNFGVISGGFVGSRVSPSYDLTSVGVLQDSYIAWQGDFPAGTIADIEVSFDGGGTYTSCTNGGSIPGLTQDMDVTGMNMLVSASLSTPNPSLAPFISGLTFWIVGRLSASGYRIGPPLSLGSLGGRVGSSLISWDANVPNDATGYGIDVSPDGVNWTDVTSFGAFGGGAISFINSQDDPPFIDDFSADTSANYAAFTTSGEGAAATWLIDTTNSRLIGTGGNSAFFAPASSFLGDGEIIIDTDQCEQGGVIWRLSSDLSTYYSLWIMDASAARSPNRMKLFKVQNGLRTQLGLGVVLNFVRGVPQRFKIVQVGGQITVTVDSVIILADGTVVSNITQTLTYTDTTPLQGGGVGFRSSGGMQRYSQLRIMNYGDDVSQSVLYTRTRLFSIDPLNTPQIQSLTVAVRSNSIGNGKLVPVTTYSTLSGSQNTIAQDFDDLARLSGSYWWKIRDRVLYFQPQTGMPAPWIATGKDMLVMSPINVSFANDLYRNQSIIIGGTDTKTIPETRIADGFRTSFDTGYPIDSISSILVNGQSQSFGLQGVDTGKSWYYQQGQPGYTADSSAAPLPAGAEVQTTYAGLVPVIAKARNEGHIQLLKSIDRTSGVVSVAEKADGLNQAAAEALALARLEQYAVLSCTITFTTNRPGLHMGQLLTVYLPQHALNNQTFLITQVDYQPMTAVVNGQVSLLEYFKVQATSGPIVGSWIHLF